MKQSESDNKMKISLPDTLERYEADQITVELDNGDRFSITCSEDHMTVWTHPSKLLSITPIGTRAIQLERLEK